MPRLKYLFILLILCVFSNCLYPYTAYKGELTNDALTGDWKPTEKSMAFLKSENNTAEIKEIKLTLSAGNTFVLTNLPDCFKDNFGKCRGGYYSLKGEWKLDIREDSSKDLFLIERTSDQTKIYAIPLIKENDEIQIAFFFGDPDMGRAIYFTKY